MASKELLKAIGNYLYMEKIVSPDGTKMINPIYRDELISAAQIENARIMQDISKTSYQYFNTINSMRNIRNAKAIGPLACLFPKRVILTSFFEQENRVYVIASIYSKYKHFIESGLMDLYIDTVNRPVDWEPGTSPSDNPETMQNRQIHLLTKSVEDLNYQSIELALPWLANLNPLDYIDLLKKYELQFEIYCRQIDKISESARTPELLTSTLISEVKDAFIDIRICMEKAKEELRRKGKTAVMGAVATAIPFLVPQDAQFISPALLSSLLGATNIFTTVPSLLDSYSDVKRTSMYNPYWLLWKWNNISKVKL